MNCAVEHYIHCMMVEERQKKKKAPHSPFVMPEREGEK